MINISHTSHMSNLFLKGIIWDSMHFNQIAEIMTQNGLETTESGAMEAYDNCMELGYPRGGNPSAWNLGPIGSSSPRWIEYSECEYMSCGNEVERVGDLCSDCITLDEADNNWVLINHELTTRGSAPHHTDRCRCGKRHTTLTCTQCLSPLCMSCTPRIPAQFHLLHQHYECMTFLQRMRLVKA